jgi:hypothetical protein
MKKSYFKKKQKYPAENPGIDDRQPFCMIFFSINMQFPSTFHHARKNIRGSTLLSQQRHDVNLTLLVA